MSFNSICELLRRVRSRGRIVTIAPAIAAVAASGMIMGACTVYQPAPVVYAPAQPSAFDRSWNAALASFEDQGVAVSSADRSTGMIRGRRGDIELTANLRTQADGSVRVQFNRVDATNQDPQLMKRVSRSFDARMGR